MIDRDVDKCLNDKELDDYMFGRLDAATLESVEEHLLFCGGCQDLVEKEQVFVRDFRNAARLGVLARQRPPARWMAPVGIAAAVIIGLSLMLVPGGVAPTSDAIAQVDLAVTRSVSAGQMAQAPARQPFRLSLDLEQLPARASYDVEIVDSAGGRVFRGSAAGQDGRLSLQASSLPPGSYWVRLSSGGSLLREYGLKAQ
jgi:hypothetical protein